MFISSFWDGFLCFLTFPSCQYFPANDPFLFGQNPDIGKKDVWTGDRLLIDAADVESLVAGQNATFINWGNLRVVDVAPAGDQVTVETNLSDKDYKKTPKLTWLGQSDGAPALTPCTCVYFEHLISKPVLGKDEDFKQYVQTETRREVAMLGEPQLARVRRGDIIQ